MTSRNIRHNLTFLNQRWLSVESKDESNKAEATEAVKPSSNIKDKEYPEEPTTCCMSGCGNCVWLEYAEKLSEFYKDGGEQAMNEINERVADANIRAYLLHELRMRRKSS